MNTRPTGGMNSLYQHLFAQLLHGPALSCMQHSVSYDMSSSSNNSKTYAVHSFIASVCDNGFVCGTVWFPTLTVFVLALRPIVALGFALLR